MNSVGLPTLQGYGLTETSPVVSCNPIRKIKVETVGPPFRGNQVKIAEDGEILVKGENVMLGYWNKKEETDKVIVNGWLQIYFLKVFLFFLHKIPLPLQLSGQIAHNVRRNGTEEAMSKIQA